MPMNADDLLEIIVNDIRKDIEQLKSDEAAIRVSQSEIKDSQAKMAKDITDLKAEYDEVLKTEKEIRKWVKIGVKYLGPIVSAIYGTLQILMFFGVHL